MSLEHPGCSSRCPWSRPRSARTSSALSAAYRDLGSRLGRAPRTTEVTFAFVGLAALALAAAALLSPFLSPRLP